MPTYTYLCRECGTHFEAVTSIQRKAAGWQPCCPRCHSSQTQQTFEPPALINVSRGGSSSGSCGCTSCR